MRTLRPLFSSLLAVSMVALLAAPASAETKSRRDEAGDVLVGDPAPYDKSTDIYGFRATFTNDALHPEVIVRIRMRNVVKPLRSDQYVAVDFRAEGEPHTISGTNYGAHGCGSCTFRFNAQTDTVTVKIPVQVFGAARVIRQVQVTSANMDHRPYYSEGWTSSWDTAGTIRRLEKG